MKKKILYLASFDEKVVADIKWALENLLVNFEFEVIRNLSQLAEVLFEEEEKIAAIILDLFLSSVRDLASIGKPEVKTINGTYAGFMILEHFLRQENSPYRNIPVLILTAKILTQGEKELIQKLKADKVEYIELFGPGWRERFKSFINRLFLK